MTFRHKKLFRQLVLKMSKEVESTTREYLFLQKYLNSARKESRSSDDKNKERASTSSGSNKGEDWLTKWVVELKDIVSCTWLFVYIFHRKAIEELEREICINKVKRKAFGSVTAPKARANKRFLASTLSQCLSHNKREQRKHNENSTDKLKQLDREHRLKKSKEKFGDRKHEYKKPEKRKKKRRRSSSSSSSE